MKKCAFDDADTNRRQGMFRYGVGVAVLLLLAWPRIGFAANQGGALGAESAVTGAAQVVTGLLAVVALILVGAWMLRRFGRFSVGAEGSMKVLGGISVGTRERVVLVQVGETQLLLGIAPGRVQTLHVLDNPIAMSAPGSEGASAFGVRLAALLKQGRVT
jgi:flagellar protein FliO/FliZ